MRLTRFMVDFLTVPTIRWGGVRIRLSKINHQVVISHKPRFSRTDRDGIEILFSNDLIPYRYEQIEKATHPFFNNGEFINTSSIEHKQGMPGYYLWEDNPLFHLNFMVCRKALLNIADISCRELFDYQEKTINALSTLTPSLLPSIKEYKETIEMLEAAEKFMQLKWLDF